MSKEYPLDGFALEIKAHWAKYRPDMYRQFEQAGNLDQALYEASERTGEAFASLVEGTEPIQAWEAVREEWAFLRAEQDEPSLPSDPTSRPAPPAPPRELYPPESDRAERDLTEDR